MLTFGNNYIYVFLVLNDIDYAIYKLSGAAFSKFHHMARMEKKKRLIICPFNPFCTLINADLSADKGRGSGIVIAGANDFILGINRGPQGSSVLTTIGAF